MDWTGNSKSTFVTLGASNHSSGQREPADYYATEPKALEKLLEQETFAPWIWEPACGQGHLSEVLVRHGYHVKSTDLVDRGYGAGGGDFLTTKVVFYGDIITNPPYKFAQEFVEHALETVAPGHKVAMLLKLTFLEGKKRRKLFDVCPPNRLYVFSERIQCALNGDFERYSKGNSSAVAYGWYIWEKGRRTEPIIRWI